MKPSQAAAASMFSLMMFIAGYFGSPKLWPFIDGATWVIFGLVAMFALVAMVGTIIDDC